MFYNKFICGRDVNTEFLANRILVVENQLETGFQFYWPSQKFKFQTQLNLVIYRGFC